MSAAETFVCGIGAVTAVGDSAEQTYASVKAGVSRYQQTEYCNAELENIVMAMLPDDALPPLAPPLRKDHSINQRRKRMLQLADVALMQCLKSAGDIDGKLPLFLAGPETLPGQPLAITDSFINALVEQTGAPIDIINSTVIPHGRAAGIIALEAAIQQLAKGTSPYVLVGGVDSYADDDLLYQLMEENRTLASGIMDGFAPGEGAAFLLLTAKPDDAAGLARLMQPGHAEESGHRYSNEPYLGDGLAEAFAIALQNSKQPVTTVFASLNGENHGAKEWGVAYARNSATIDTEFELCHPADCFGDTGAAIGPILLALAALGFQSGDLSAPALVWAASDGPKRAAVCVTGA
jgi:3-oxoacyl-[acyl-carrier-protein] synthase-1